MRVLTEKIEENSILRCVRRGMTLIEVMLAVGILAAVMAAGWGSYIAATTNQQRMQEINDRLHGDEQAVNRIVREKSTAFITPPHSNTSNITCGTPPRSKPRPPRSARTFFEQTAAKLQRRGL